MTLAEADKHSWSKIRREAMGILEDRGVVLCGVELDVAKSDKALGGGQAPAKLVLSPPELILRFVEHEEWGGDALEAAMEVVES